MPTKIGGNKVAMMKTDELVNVAKTGRPKAKAKARIELQKRGKLALVAKIDKVA